MLFTSYTTDRYQTTVCTVKPLPAFERIPRTKMHRFQKSGINYFVLMRIGSCMRCFSAFRRNIARDYRVFLSRRRESMEEFWIHEL